MAEMTELELVILNAADWIHQRPDQGHGKDGWFKPMHIGGSDASPHSDTLRKLVGKGLIERKRWGRAYAYRVTPLGLAEIRKPIGSHDIGESLK